MAYVRALSRRLVLFLLSLAAWLTSSEAITFHRRGFGETRMFRRGRWLPVFAGGSPEGEEEEQEEEAEEEEEGKDYRAELRKYERTSKAAAKKKDAELAKLQAELDELKKGAQTDQEKALEDAKREAAEQAKKDTAAQYHDRILKAEIRARAAGKFANPALAHRLVDLEDPFDENGELQGEALDAALDAVLEENPNLAPADPNPGDPDAGKGGGSDATAEAMSVEDHLKDIQGGE